MIDAILERDLVHVPKMERQVSRNRNMVGHLPELAGSPEWASMKAFRIMRLALVEITTGLFGSAIILCAIPGAKAHEAPTGWSYPISCCSGFDCRAVQDPAVKERPEGYLVPSGEVLAMTDNRIRHSPDGLFHLCTIGGTDAGRTICLFVPPRSY